MASRTIRTDVCVVGGGSGGFGAALAAARGGLHVVLIERQAMLGGTSTVGGVNCWEMGTGGTGFPFELYCRLRAIPDAVGIYSCGRHFSWQDGRYWPHQLDKVNFPGGENVIDPERCYLDTLRRHPGPDHVKGEAFAREFWHGVPFEPVRMAEAMQTALDDTGYCDVRLGEALTAVDAAGGVVSAVGLASGARLEARCWIDGSGALAARAGCQILRGVDPCDVFGEPDAPAERVARVNAATLIFRVTPVGEPEVAPLPAGIPDACWWAPHFPPVCCNHYPNGDRNLNMLPTLRGEELLQLSPEDAYAEATRRVHAQWRFLQVNFPEFRRYRLSWVAPMLGVRESFRVLAEAMLTQHDLDGGLSRQAHPDIIAVADHAKDVHGAGGGCAELDEPYGVPYRCLVPKGWRNLLVAGRCAGFSSIGASSCRLSRTMMQLGQAAGNAAVLASAQGAALPDVDADALRARLREQHVQLAWPIELEIREHIQLSDPVT